MGDCTQRFIVRIYRDMYFFYFRIDGSEKERGRRGDDIRVSNAFGAIGFDGKMRADGR